MNTIPFENRVREYFDTVSADYSERSQRGIWRRLRRRENEGILRLIGGGPLNDVLELGSGDGYYARQLSRRGLQSLVCVDLSSKMLEKLDIPNCTKIVADIQDYVSERRFDLILCAGALEFLHRPEQVLCNSGRMLKRGGSLVVLFPRVSAMGRIYKLFHRIHGISIHLFHLSEVRQWARTAGLSIASVDTVFPFSCIIKMIRTEVPS